MCSTMICTEEKNQNYKISSKVKVRTTKRKDLSNQLICRKKLYDIQYFYSLYFLISVFYSKYLFYLIAISLNQNIVFNIINKFDTSSSMYIYLTIIGLISIISCALIMICITTKTQKSNLNIQDRNSPLHKTGLTENQKSQLLFAVCAIFFLSLVTTNIKTSKFSIMLDRIWSSSQQNMSHHVMDLNQIFYGLKRTCKINTKQTKYPLFTKYLKQTQKYNKLIDDIIQRNFEYTNQVIYKQLLIIKSSPSSKQVEQILPILTQKICLNNKNPFIYIDLQKPILLQQQLMQKMNIQSYETLRYAVCKLNNIEIRKQIVRNEHNQYVKKDKYHSKHDQQTKKVYLVINNFQYILNTLILSKHVNMQTKVDESSQHSVQNKQKSVETISNQILTQDYYFFIDKLFNQLIDKCKVNVILQSENDQALNQLYQKWKIFSKTSKLSINDQIVNKQFPFVIKQWQGLKKLDFYQILKQIIQIQRDLKLNQKLVWRIFDRQFGNILLSSNSKNSHSSGLKNYIQNNQPLSFSQIQQFFQKLTSEFNITNVQKKHSLQSKPEMDQKSQVATFYKLGQTYQAIKNLLYTQIQQNGVKVGLAKKKKIPLQQVQKLRSIGLVQIRHGYIYLVK